MTVRIRSFAALTIALTLGLAACATQAPAPAPTAAVPGKSNPDKLWQIVHDKCVPHTQSAGDPKPCAAVDLSAGYAVLKDLVGPSQYLVIPTAKITGIESPELLKTSSPNYWQAAWDARRFVAQKLNQTIARDDIALAINSLHGRTQNQLHIHVDCVRADVKADLAAERNHITRTWAPLATRFAGHPYRARWLAGAELASNDPFKLLAKSDSVTAADMGAQTLVVIGGTDRKGRPGFFLLANHADPARNDTASGEELQGHDCGVLTAMH